MKKNLNYISIGLSLVGLVLAYLLILEYYGLKSDISKTLCSSENIDACQKVAESDFSAIKNVPLLGDLPVALFGFIFYGFLIFLFSSIQKIKEKKDIILSFAFYLLLLGLLVNIILFSISFFVIDTICNLCFITYIVEIAILGLTFFQIKGKLSGLDNILSLIKEQFLNYVSVAILLLAIGVFIGNSSKQNSNLSHNNSEQGHEGHNHGHNGHDHGEYNVDQKIEEYKNSKALNLDISKAPILGDKNAPITIVKYADFNCIHCMNTSKLLDKFLDKYSGIIRVLPKNFPLDGNCNSLVPQKRPGATSCIATSAVICAQEQNKFEPVYKTLYSNMEKGVEHTPDVVLNIAREFSLDIQKFNQCMSSEELMNRINEEVSEAGRLEIQSTPTLFVNNKRIDSGTPNEEFLHKLIEYLMNTM